jgi:glyoxylase-like metal-dependent hydrolase (beta-lactamase superfamily II)
MCPRGRRLIEGGGGLWEPAKLCGHCLLVEADTGLVLVDTGFGLINLREPNLLSPVARALLRPEIADERTAVRQIRAMGFRHEDVRDIVVTHLDIDHAGGLPDFPEARVHVFTSELAAARARRPGRDRLRYVPAYWRHGPHWVVHEPAGEDWFGFAGVHPLSAGMTDVVMIPLYGHSAGHAGVAVRSDPGWLLHCGDAYFDHREVDPRAPTCPVGLRLFQRVIEHNHATRVANQRRLRQLLRDHSGIVRTICAHDPVEFERECGR